MSILEDGPVRRILRERRRELLAQRRVSEAEKTIQEWRGRYPESAVKMALKMADRWLKAVTK